CVSEAQRLLASARPDPIHCESYQAVITMLPNHAGLPALLGLCLPNLVAVSHERFPPFGGPVRNRSLGGFILHPVVDPVEESWVAGSNRWVDVRAGKKD